MGLKGVRSHIGLGGGGGGEMAKTLHLKVRKGVCNIIISPGDMNGTRVEIMF